MKWFLGIGQGFLAVAFLAMDFVKDTSDCLPDAPLAHAMVTVFGVVCGLTSFVLLAETA